MSRFFLENTWGLAGAGCAILLALLWFWSRRRTAGSRNALLAALGLVVALLTVQALVRTQRERIIDLIATLVDDVESANLTAVTGAIDESYQWEGMDKPALAEHVRRTLEQYHVEEARSKQFNVEVSGEEAVAEFTVTCRVVTPDRIEPFVTSRWRLRLVRRGDQWRITRIEPLKIGLWEKPSWPLMMVRPPSLAADPSHQ